MCRYNYLSHLNSLPNSVLCIHVKLLRDRKVWGIYHVGKKKISFRSILILSQRYFYSWEGLNCVGDGWYCKAALFGLNSMQIHWTVWEQAIPKLWVSLCVLVNKSLKRFKAYALDLSAEPGSCFNIPLRFHTRRFVQWVFWLMFYQKGWLCWDQAQSDWLTGKLVSSGVTSLPCMWFVGVCSRDAVWRWMLLGGKYCTNREGEQLSLRTFPTCGMLYIRCSLLSLFNRCRPRQRSDWLEYGLIRQDTSSPLSLVSRETSRKKRVPMTVGTEVETEAGSGLSLQGTLEIELWAGKILFPLTTEDHCFILRKSWCRLRAKSSNVNITNIWIFFSKPYSVFSVGSCESHWTVPIGTI